MKGPGKPHVAAVPFPALGHTIPILDMATLLASHGLTVSYVTTPANVSRVQQPILEAAAKGLDIRLVVLPAPAVRGLPEGHESSDQIPAESTDLIRELAEKLQHPLRPLDRAPIRRRNPSAVATIKFVLGRFQSIGRGSGMLINTFHELEPAHLDHLKNVTDKPVWGIGPVFPPSGSDKVSVRGKMADIGEEELIRWLDSQSPRSVVYLSFGSQTYLTPQQTNALARGVELSEQPFVWAIKIPPRIEPATSDSASFARRYLPEGFQERTKNRGVVIWGWAPQLLILSHPAVGGFASHCGWNSTLESVTQGIPLIAWPMYGDQPFNSKLIADLGAGIQFCQYRDAIPNAERVKEVIRRVLIEDKGKEMRKSAEKMKEKARITVEDGGSSRADLQAFVNVVRELHTKLGKNKKERSHKCC
ncbi:hypothetical protein KI387_027552 [Taxus chinensis]|uniref:Glycosyltransferase N-terminal domain-containing protein n=1 Tax=Taxus chinensis TaxID=29808 RepID=A0AA38L9M1_TAXCH|nr:hypothetical protein KI387_027552 [Taxus chinensis]